MIGRDVHSLKNDIKISEDFMIGIETPFGVEILKFINSERDPLKVERAQSEFELAVIKGRFEGLRSVLDFIKGKIEIGRIAKKTLEELNGQS